jgi:hypothetical protein
VFKIMREGGLPIIVKKKQKVVSIVSRESFEIKQMKSLVNNAKYSLSPSRT